MAAVDEDGRTLTWGEVKTAAERAAAGFHRLGIGAGDVVSWQLPTWLESKILVLALARLGAIQNPMLPIYREREVGFITSTQEVTAQAEPSRASAHEPKVELDAPYLAEMVRRTMSDRYGAESETPPGYSRDWGEASGAETLLAAASRHLLPIATQAAGAGDVIVFRLRAGLAAKHAAILTGPGSFVHAMEGAPVTEVTGAMNRYPRRDSVSMKRGWVPASSSA